MAIDTAAGEATDEAEGLAFAERLVEAVTASLEVFTVYVGVRLGLYAALDRGGPLDVDGLAADAGVHRRYAREWLEQQAAAGILAVAGDDPDPYRRRFTLPAAHRPVLVEATNPLHLVGAARCVVAIDVNSDLRPRSTVRSTAVAYQPHG